MPCQVAKRSRITVLITSRGQALALSSAIKGWMPNCPAAISAMMTSSNQKSPLRNTAHPDFSAANSIR